MSAPRGWRKKAERRCAHHGGKNKLAACSCELAALPVIPSWHPGADFNKTSA
jgi:hypothetical protein